MKHIVETRNIYEEIDKSIARNETLQEYQHNTKLSRDDNLWIRVKDRTKKHIIEPKQ